MIEALLAGFIVSIVTTFLVMPGIIRTMNRHGMTGPDMNKPGKPQIAEMGGIGVLVGFFAGVFTTIGWLKFVQPTIIPNSHLLLASMFAILGAGLVGAIDDLFDLRQRIKAILPAFFALPMAYYLVSEPVNLPFVGAISFGYWMLLIIPFMMTASANAANMLEGFNGLGAGLGVIMGLSIVVLSFLKGNLMGVVIVLPLVGALLAFLYFNYYPAKVFPGDTMMLMMGSALAVGAIVGGIKEAAVILFIPMIAEFFVKLRGNFHARNHGTPDKNGILHYDARVESTTHLVMKAFKVRETSFVHIFWAAQFLLSVVAISLVTLL